MSRGLAWRKASENELEHLCYRIEILESELKEATTGDMTTQERALMHGQVAGMMSYSMALRARVNQDELEALNNE